MTIGISLHIGLNHVDPNQYNGWDGELAGCINDAGDMQAIANSLGYQSTLMTESQATSTTVVRAIGQAAQRLQSGDIYLLTYSGHGAQVPDSTSDEADAQDETWVLWDRMLLDDELNQLWAQFRAGVRIFMLSDSCHSGTVARMILFSEMMKSDPIAKQYRRMRSRPPKFRLMDRSVQEAVYQRDKAFYEAAQWTSGGNRATVTASVTLISGCQDNQLSADGERNGLFTETLLEVWNRGAFQGNYASFHSAIVDRMPPTQTPNLFRVGATNTSFEVEKPFTIGEASGTSVVVSGQPTIQATASVSPNDPPPVFSVNPGANRYYVVEVATRADLLNFAANGGQRNDDNFFGSWRTTPFGFSPSYPASYELPSAVWERLKRNANRLYYRLWATDSPNSWVNHASTTSDSQASSAPSIEIVEGATGALAPWINADSSIPNSPTPPRFQVNPGANRYYVVEVATQADLLNFAANGGQRNDDNFFGSWRTTPFGFSPSYPASYELPSAVWERLRRSATQLYYRLWASDSPNSWVNHVATTPDQDASSAPMIRIAREAGAPRETVAAQWC